MKPPGLCKKAWRYQRERWFWQEEKCEQGIAGDLGAHGSFGHWWMGGKPNQNLASWKDAGRLKGGAEVGSALSTLHSVRRPREGGWKSDETMMLVSFLLFFLSKVLGVSFVFVFNSCNAVI
jgi:hypothetical protein